MSRDGYTPITVALPDELYDRCRRVKKRLRTTMTQLIRDGLNERVDYHNARFDAEDARLQQEKEERRRGARGFGSSKMAPQRSPLAAVAPVALGDEAAPVEDLDDLAYRRAAAHVLEVLDRPDPTEKRVRIAEAVEAIKRRSPLTHPPDAEILRRLEAAVMRLRDERPSATPAAAASAPPPVINSRVYDDLVGREIDPAVKTAGDMALHEND